MLALTRKAGQSIVVGDQVEIVIVEIKGDQVRLGIKAPREVSIYRKEIYEEIQRENKAAVDSAKVSLDGVDQVLMEAIKVQTKK